ncbi:MAG: ABC transporter ATP-binding protein [Chloroflexota bacterium]|nr:ABC transporter ATP-binding protein [Chloroflexota bacterium]
MKLTEDFAPVQEAERAAPDANVGTVSQQGNDACTDAPCVIDARGLRKDFGTHAVLTDLSLQVRAGEIFGLIGPSGSGKSTTIHLLYGHLRPSGGTACVFGERPVHFSARTRARIGYMPQGFILYPDLTVKQNVDAAAGLYGLSEWHNRRSIRAVLELVELWEARGKTVRSISGGMQRRLALAAALVHDPDLLFADEPTANLDPILRMRLWKHFRGMSERGKTLLVTTQYIDEAEHCDRVGVMYGGALIAEGRPEELRHRAFGGDVVDITFERPSESYLQVVSSVAGVREAQSPPDESLRLTVEDAERVIPGLLAQLSTSGAKVRSVAQYRPTFDEVFIRLIEQHSGSRPPAGGLTTSASAQEEAD